VADECRRYSKPKQCHFRDTVYMYSMTETRQFLGFMFPQVVQRQ